MTRRAFGFGLTAGAIAGAWGASGSAAGDNRYPDIPVPPPCTDLEGRTDKLSQIHFADLVDGYFRYEFGPRNMEIAFEHFDYQRKTGQVKSLVVHFHGGLVDRCDGLDEATRLLPIYYEAGAYPYFFVYNVGVQESISKGLTLANLWTFDLPTDRPGDIDVPAHDVPDNSAMGILFSRRAQIHHDYTERAEHCHFHGGDTRKEERMRWSVLFNNVERVGGTSWRYMKQTIYNSCQTPGLMKNYIYNFPPNDGGRSVARIVSDRARWARRYRPVCEESSPDRCKSYAGAYSFLKNLAQVPHDVTVTLVGHSLGAIYIARFLQAAKQIPELRDRKFRVILLAPAVSHEEFYHAVVRDAGVIDNVESIRIFVMSDIYESHNAVLNTTFGALGSLSGNLYGRSLLYVVSGIFERKPDMPILGLERFRRVDLDLYSDTPFYREQARYIREVGAYIASKQVGTHFDGFVLSPTAIGAPVGARCHSTDHGDFPRDAQTVESVAALIADETKWSTPLSEKELAGPVAVQDPCVPN